MKKQKLTIRPVRLIFILSFFLMIVLVYFYFHNDSNPTYRINHRFNKSQLLSDFRDLCNVISEHHPGLRYYDYNREFMRTADSLEQQIQNHMSVRKFYLLINPIVAKTHCGHTSLSLPSHFWEQVNVRYRHFPLKLFYQQQRAFCLKNYTNDSRIHPGDEIIRINGISMQTLCKRFLLHFTADGFNRTYKYAKMNRIDYGLFPALPDFPDRFEVEFKDQRNSTIKTTSLTALNKSEIDSQLLDHPDQKAIYRAFYTQRIDSLNAGIMTIRDFVSLPGKEFRSLFKIAFNEFINRQTKYLFLDLRGNDGGDPYHANTLLSYLVPSEYRYFSERVYGYADLKTLQKPAKTIFEGKLYVLFDGGSFSTTGHLLSILDNENIGTLIGEESGGSFLCFGAPEEYTLPNTGLMLNYTRVVYATEVNNTRLGQGNIPDYHVVPDIHDLVKGEDTVMAFALNLAFPKMHNRFPKKGDLVAE